MQAINPKHINHIKWQCHYRPLTGRCLEGTARLVAWKPGFSFPGQLLFLKQLSMVGLMDMHYCIIVRACMIFENRVISEVQCNFKRPQLLHQPVAALKHQRNRTYTLHHLHKPNNACKVDTKSTLKFVLANSSKTVYVLIVRGMKCIVVTL